MNQTKRITSAMLIALATLTMVLVGCSDVSAVPPVETTETDTAASLEIETSATVVEPEAASQKVDETAGQIADEIVAPEVTTPDSETAPEAVEVAAATDRVAVGTLTEDEVAGLLFMREEEKLAHDVYLTLYEQWGQETFANIAESEQTHTEAVAGLLVAYGLDDPAVSRGIGDSADADVQALYDQLVDQGSESLDAALRVGAAIEEIDILDLEHHISLTDNADIIRVYQNLMAGSENHLRAFATVIERLSGSAYQPDYLSQESYDLIVKASSGRRNGRN